MLVKYTLVIAMLALIMSTLAVVSPASASVLEGLRPSGSTRYAVAASAILTSTYWTSFADVPGLSTSISIPSGKRGDVFIFFCGEQAASATGTALYVRGMVGGSQALPGSVILDDAPVVTLRTRCVNFYKLNVPEGSRNVHIEWAISNPPHTHVMEERSMIVTVNIHD